MAHAWGYSRANGPATWCNVAPAAKGLHQSPVDIEAADTVFDPKLAASPLQITYVPANSKSILNNGHSVQVLIDGEGSLLHGGPFPHKYKVEQFHFHWGVSSTHGAEHYVNGKPHAAELHLVHWNTELYTSFGEAAKSSNGLAVLGVFLTAGAEHPGLGKLVELLPQVTFAGDQASIVGGYDPASLLPADRTKYWTYSGSLTTPPCYESVRFLIFKDPITVSEAQLDAFRQLRHFKKGETAATNEANEGRIVDNFRHVCPLNDRKILSSFAA
jgi:carbonic anhydrase